METRQPKLPPLDIGLPVSTRPREPPSYVQQQAEMSSGATQAPPPSLTPRPPPAVEGDPPCLTNGKGEQIPRDYIERWTITDQNKERRVKELAYTIKLLKSKETKELVTNSSGYERDFYLLSKGMYRKYSDNTGNKKLVVKTCVDNGVIELFKTYWQSIITVFEAERSTVDEKSADTGSLWNLYHLNPAKRYITDALNNCYHLMVIFWNGTDITEPSIRRQMYDGLWLLLLEILDKRMCPVKQPQLKLTKSVLGTLHNFCQKYGPAITDLREKQGLSILIKYRNEGNETLQAKSILTSAYLLEAEDGEKEKSDHKVLELEEKDLNFILKVLEDALKSTNQHSERYGYGTEELIAGINNIAVVDKNKIKLVDTGVLPLYVDAMRLVQRPDIMVVAVKGARTLAFVEGNKNKIIKEPGLMELLRDFTTSNDEKVKRAAEGALWTIEGESKHIEKSQRIPSGGGGASVTSSESTANQKHVMISYQWDVQDQVLKVRDRLKKAGYRVWIDVEQMRKSDNTLQAMAEAVENAACIIPVLTDKYSRSDPCRQEATYANRLKKKLVPLRMQPKYRPDGWLAFLLGDTFFYDLSNPKSYESKFKEFLEALGPLGKTQPGEEIAVSEPVGTTALVPAQPPVSSSDLPVPTSSIQTVFDVTRLKCVSWTQQRVSDWVKQIGLEKYVKKLSGVDGRLLAELAAVQFISPDVYYSMMRQEHGMTMLDILKLNKALRELNNY